MLVTIVTKNLKHERIHSGENHFSVNIVSKNSLKYVLLVHEENKPFGAIIFGIPILDFRRAEVRGLVSFEQ